MLSLARAALTLTACRAVCGEGAIERDGACAISLDFPSDSGAETDTGTDTDSGTDPDTGPPADTDPSDDPGLVRVPASTFLMGCTDGQSACEADEKLHEVTLTRDYFVNHAEVTQGEFETTMGYNPSALVPCGANCSAETLTWYEAAAYANALSRQFGLPECYTCEGSEELVVCDVAMDPYTCHGYRMLTESEWEGAARCGEDLVYAGSNDAAAVAWTSENAEETTHPVASLAPNACGLHDMSGNVWEWTDTWYGDYGLDPLTDPAGPAAGSSRVVRGGGWSNDVLFARVSARNGIVTPSYARGSIGFRVMRLGL